MTPSKSPSPQTFGQRLATLRRARGWTQRDLAPRLGISQRMVAYYEKQTERPPAHLLEKLAQVLGVSSDELLGIHPTTNEAPGMSPRLYKRLRQIEQLPPDEKRAVLKIIDSLLERHTRPHPAHA